MTRRDDDKTPLQTATIAADRMVRAPLGQLISATFILGGAVVWATCVWRDVQDLKRDMADVKAILRGHPPSPMISDNRSTPVLDNP